MDINISICISQVFGAFLSTDVIERRKHEAEELTYFGTGECFVFTVRHVCAWPLYCSCQQRKVKSTSSLQLRPNMERYQRPMVNILTKRPPGQQVPSVNSTSAEVLRSISSTSGPAVTIASLTCPAGTPQDPSYLTIPFTAPSGGSMSAKVPKRPKEQDASMFIACSDTQLIVGTDVHSRHCRSLVMFAALTSAYLPRWRWRVCALPARRPEGGILRGLWNIWEWPALQGIFQDPSCWSVGHPELYFLVPQSLLSLITTPRLESTTPPTEPYLFF